MAETNTPAAEIRTRGLLRLIDEVDGTTLMDDEGFCVADVSDCYAVLHNWGDVAEGALHWADRPGVLYRDVSEEEAEGTARRLAALWNAAERLGIPTDLVDRYLEDLLALAHHGATQAQAAWRIYLNQQIDPATLKADPSPTLVQAEALNEQAEQLLPLITQARGVAT